MKRSKSVVGLVTVALVLPLGAMTATATEIAPADATAWTEWISDDGASAGRELPAISANGRYVALVGRADASAGVWVKDRAKPAVPARRVAAGFFVNVDISADGRYVAYAERGGDQAVYRLAWQNPDAEPVLVSRADGAKGAIASAVSDFPSLSGNGRYVAFQSMDKMLDDDVKPGKTGGGPNKVYVRDMVTYDTEMVSVVDAPTGDQVINGQGLKPDITPDGRFVAFASDASVLQGTEEVTAAAEEEEVVYQQIYRRDRVAKTTIPVSVSSAEVLGDGSSATAAGPTISDNGLQVAFESMAENLVAGDTNLDTDAFVRRIGAGTTVRISLNSAGGQVNTDDTGDIAAGELEDDPETMEDESKAVDALPVGMYPAINGMAGLIAFASTAGLMTEDENGVADIYRFGLDDSAAPGLTRWSVVDDPDDELAFEASGTRTDGSTGETVPASNGSDPTISADGTRIAFVSQGNLTGRAVEAEEGEETEAVTAIEPNIYLHRANPEPDTTAPTSKASSRLRDYTSPIKVTYTRSDPGFPASGVVAVRLYVKKPFETKFFLRQVDKIGAMNGSFLVTAKAKGIYRFYTVAKDARGNLEKAPLKADTYTVRK